MAVKNLQGLAAAVAAVAPIDGLDANGVIWFQASATPAQMTAAQALVASWLDVVPQVVSITTILSVMTDPEYTALMTFANTHPQIHRAIFALRQVDLSLPAVQNLIQALITAGVVTAPRAAVVFAPPPPLPAPPPVVQ
jgi:hypothetical protein